MLKLLFSIAIIFSYSSVQSQRLWGVTFEGGSQDEGTIFSIDTLGNDHQIEYEFYKSKGSQAKRNFLTKGPGNTLFGVISGGGDFNEGVLFEYDPNTAQYDPFHSFDVPFSMPYNTSGIPWSGLILASDGYLYGTNSSGGANLDGTIFKVDPVQKTVTDIYNFISNTGKSPNGALLQIDPDTLLGTTGAGGQFSSGVLFKYSISDNNYVVVKDFTFGEGMGGRGKLIQASDGNVYGVCGLGGANNKGSIFKYNTSTNVFQIVHNFLDGNFPEGGLCEAGSSGKLYGLTPEGGSTNRGIIYEYDINLNQFTKKHDLSIPTGGAKPKGEFIEGINGTLITTCYGMVGSIGTIIEYNPTNDALNELSNFSDLPFASDNYGGENPVGTLCNLNGVLYGITEFGGTASSGTLFSYDELSDKRTKLVNLAGADQGSGPLATLTIGPNDKLYGVGSSGMYNCGVLFEYDPLAQIYRKLFDFNDTTGRHPQVQLLYHNNGNLYGCTKGSPNANDAATLFEYNPSTEEMRILIDFDSLSITGRIIHSGLTEGPNGLLYGSTFDGGANGHGTLLKYDIGTSTHTVINSFLDTITGLGCPAELSVLNGDKYYGVTSENPQQTTNGGIFSIDLNTEVFNVEYLFSSDPGFPGDPNTKLCLAPNGSFYGTTIQYTSNGSIFEFNPSTSSYSHIQNMSWAATGGDPQDMYSYGNNIFFNCFSGSINNEGSIMKLNVSTNALTKLHDFSGIDGSGPISGFVLFPDNSSTSSIDEYSPQNDLLVYPNPSTGEIFIKANSIIIGSDLLVYDMLGKLVFTQKISSVLETLNIGGLEKGAYLFKVNSKNSTSSKRIIKL